MSNAARYLIPAVAAVILVVWLYGPGLFITVGLFLAVLLPLVIIHELGHFTTAKMFGIKVLEFGVGMPPKAWGIRKGETEYTVNWLPLGGFVRMLGEEEPAGPRSFMTQSAPKRLVVLAAGATMNAVLPIVLLFIALMIPRTVTLTDVVVTSVVEDSPAAEAGVQRGDIIVEANGAELENSVTLQNEIQQRLGADMTWTIRRDGSLIEVRIPEVRIDPPPGQGATGIQLADARVTVDSVQPGSSADAIGLQEGDLFLRVGDAIVVDAGDAAEVVDALFEADPDAPVNVEVMRGGEIVTLEIPPSIGDLDGYSVSVRPEGRQSHSFFEAVPAAFVQLGEILVLFKNSISLLISGEQGLELAGPVGIAQITGEVADAGLAPLVTWAALLSINLAIVNILPIPALDGGRIMFVLVELARGGRKIAPEKERLVHLVGFALLMAGILALTASDLQRLFNGGNVLG